jgi:PAS domain S-box-containing protein
MQKARDIAAMSAIFFEELARFTPLHQGSLYFLETDEADESALILAGSYGTAYLPARIALGEGLMGQCAVDHQVKVLTDVPDGFWRISSGMGMAMPHALLMMPVRSGEHFIGVVEVASLSADFDQARQLIDTMMPSLAMNLEILIAEKRTQHMLAEAQTNADTYMAWQEIGRQGENWLHALVDQGQDGMLVTDEGGRITFSNRAMENMLGYDKAALRGMALEKILLPPQQGASLEVPALLQGASDGSRGLAPWRNGFRLLRHDETMLAVSLALSRLPGMGLHDPGLCLVCRRA